MPRKPDTLRADLARGPVWSELDEMLWPEDSADKDRSDRTGKNYPQEFRDECIRMVIMFGMRPSEVAREKDCTATSVRNWVRKARKEMRVDGR